MSFLIYSLNKPERGVEALTGPTDANPGQAAISGDGDIYVMTNAGWQKVWDHVTGGAFDPDYQLPSNQAIVTDGQQDIFVMSQDSGGDQINSTATVSGNEITAITFVDGTIGIVSDGQGLAVDGGSVTLSVAAGVVTATYTADGA